MVDTKADVREAISNITDCFMGSDGGIKFAHFKFAIEEFVNQYEAGNEKVGQIVQTVFRFSSLLDILGEGRSSLDRPGGGRVKDE